MAVEKLEITGVNLRLSGSLLEFGYDYGLQHLVAISLTLEIDILTLRRSCIQTESR